MDVEKGKLLRANDLREAERRLIRTGVFRSVQIVPFLRDAEDADGKTDADLGDQANVGDGEKKMSQKPALPTSRSYVENEDYWDEMFADLQIKVEEMAPI